MFRRSRATHYIVHHEGTAIVLVQLRVRLTFSRLCAEPLKCAEKKAKESDRKVDFSFEGFFGGRSNLTEECGRKVAGIFLVVSRA